MVRQAAGRWSYLPPSISHNGRESPCGFHSNARMRVGGTMEKATLAGLEAKQLLELYRGMLQLRDFELKVQELYRKGMLPGFVHLYIGEEAVATGVCSNLQPGARPHTSYCR